MMQSLETGRKIKYWEGISVRWPMKYACLFYGSSLHKSLTYTCGAFLRVFRRRQYREFVAGLQATPWPGVPCNENLHDYNMTGG